MAGDSGALVSVVIPAYNAENYIRECLDSCLLQQWENIEVIVIDDCSTDSTLKILGMYGNWYRKITVLKNEENYGEYPTTNKGIRLASGDFITFLDCDDMLPRWSIRARARILEQHPDADVAYGPVQCFRDGSNFTQLDLEMRPAGFEHYPFVAPKEGLMYRRRVFEQYGLLYDKTYLHADREFVIRLGIHKPHEGYRVKNMPPAFAITESLMPMAFYRQRKGGQKAKMKTDSREHDIFKARRYELERDGITAENTEFL